jgi:hypothetical protein
MRRATQILSPVSHAGAALLARLPSRCHHTAPLTSSLDDDPAVLLALTTLTM